MLPGGKHANIVRCLLALDFVFAPNFFPSKLLSAARENRVLRQGGPIKAGEYWSLAGCHRNRFANMAAGLDYCVVSTKRTRLLSVRARTNPNSHSLWA